MSSACPSSNHRLWTFPVLIVLALAGAVSSGVLRIIHLDLAGAFLESVCGGPAGGCSEVLSSGWAYFPPVLSGADFDPTNVQGRIPLAALGLAYFLAVLAWLLALGPRALRTPKLFALLYLNVLLSCIASIAFVVVMLFQIQAICPFCLGTHLANFALLGVLFLARPKESTPDVPVVSASHVGSAAALAALVGLGSIFAGEGLQAIAERDAIAARLDEIESEASLIELAYLGERTFTADDEARARFDSILRADDPQLLPTNGAYGTLVYFSDLECPNCHKFELFLRDVIRPMFANHLRIVFKHFPLRELHEDALPAARALEAARLQGRFWDLHAELLTRYGHLGDLDFAELAADLGLDVERFRRDASSEEVARRIDEDMQLARSIGVGATPTVFLDRREVAGNVRTLVGFWQLRAQALHRARDTRNQDW